MKTTLSALVMLALIGGASAVSAQSANRSGSGIPSAPAVGTLAPEREAISGCRAHCDSVMVSGPHPSAPRQSAAERQARQGHCAKRMAS
jgi:hypothetical protein